MKTFETEQKFGKKLEHIEYFIQVGFYKTQAQCMKVWRKTTDCDNQ